MGNVVRQVIGAIICTSLGLSLSACAPDNSSRLAEICDEANSTLSDATRYLFPDANQDWVATEGIYAQLDDKLSALSSLADELGDSDLARGFSSVASNFDSLEAAATEIVFVGYNSTTSLRWAEAGNVFARNSAIQPKESKFVGCE